MGVTEQGNVCVTDGEGVEWVLMDRFRRELVEKLESNPVSMKDPDAKVVCVILDTPGIGGSSLTGGVIFSDGTRLPFAFGDAVGVVP